MIIRPIPSTFPIDPNAILSKTNQPIEGAFFADCAWIAFESFKGLKYAMKVSDVISHDYDDYVPFCNMAKIIPLPRATYESLKSRAEVITLMRGR